jgi:hypothetical protein
MLGTNMNQLLLEYIVHCILYLGSMVYTIDWVMSIYFLFVSGLIDHFETLFFHSISHICFR